MKKTPFIRAHFSETKNFGKQKPILNEGKYWEERVESFKMLSEWWFYKKWGGATDADLYHLAKHGDIVAQCFLQALNQASLSIEKKHPKILNDFENLLLKHTRRLNEFLCAAAANGTWQAANELWETALMLTDTFSQLALTNPELFKIAARKSIFMPSVRSKNTKFTANAEIIANAIELSADTVGAGLHDNRTIIGALTARLVGECVNEIMRSRKIWSGLFTRYNQPVVWPTQQQVDPFLTFVGKSLDDLLSGIPLSDHRQHTKEEGMKVMLRFFCLHADCGVERIHFLTLNELTKGQSRNWWKGAIEKMVETKFPNLLQIPIWKQELKKVSKGTHKDMLHELKKYCEGKVKQFIPVASCQ